MTVAEIYLRTDNERIIILELNKILYSGYLEDIPLKYLDKIVQKICVDYEKGAIVLCI